MKIIQTLLVLMLVLLASCSTPPEDVPTASGVDVQAGDIPTSEISIDPAKSSFEFEGYGVGKSHPGSFDAMQGVLLYKDGKLMGAKGTIHAASVNTGVSGLDIHLKTEDFFHVEMYPEISFESTSLSGDTMTGKLSFHGVTNSLSFPARVQEDSISSEFLLNMSLYGVGYKGVNELVKIAFVVAK
ncbi:YceI family protein [Nanoarchaeota archaeon]